MTRLTTSELDALIDDATMDANGDAEVLCGFLTLIQDNIAVPTNAMLAGFPVSVIGFDMQGDERRGVTAKCRNTVYGSLHEVSAADIEIEGDHCLPAYRRWLGLKPYLSVPARVSSKTKAIRKAAAEELHDFAVLSARQSIATCRCLTDGQPASFRLKKATDAISGEIIRGTIAGKMISCRLDAKALNLVPLRLNECGVWDPKEEYWGEPGAPIDEWARAIIAWGPRPAFEFERSVPGEDLDDIDGDPILEALDRLDAGDLLSAKGILLDLCEQDLRCLDAHAHLGNMSFRLRSKAAAELALRHYETGVRIAELSLGDNFEGVLLWGMIDNRAFHRCLHGYGISLWRLKRFAEAAKVFERMLWLNPTDNLGARDLLTEARAHRPWRDSY